MSGCLQRWAAAGGQLQYLVQSMPLVQSLGSILLVVAAEVSIFHCKCELVAAHCEHLPFCCPRQLSEYAQFGRDASKAAGLVEVLNCLLSRPGMNLRAQVVACASRQAEWSTGWSVLTLDFVLRCAGSHGTGC